MIDADSLRRALDDHPGEPGVRLLRHVLDEHTFRLSDDELERLFRPLAAAAGLPTPLTKVMVNKFEVDFFWPDLGLVVETDGWRYHRTPSAQTRDALRFQVHVANGLTPLRFSHYQVKYRTPPRHRHPHQDRRELTRPPCTLTKQVRVQGGRAGGASGEGETWSRVEAQLSELVGAMTPQTSESLTRCSGGWASPSPCVPADADAGRFVDRFDDLAGVGDPVEDEVVVVGCRGVEVDVADLHQALVDALR